MAVEPDTHKQNPHQPHTVAIAGGGGGVGKSSIALNLGLTLARQGKRVLLLDGDTGPASLVGRLGREPEKDLEGVFEGQYDLEEVLLTTDYDLQILPGAGALCRCLEAQSASALHVLEAMAALERTFDYVIVDTGSDMDLAGLHMVASAALACLVVTPDPESLKRTFSLIRRLNRRGYRRTPSVVVNMAPGASLAQSVFQRLDSAVGRHLGNSLHYLGAVCRDETLRQSAVTGVPVATLPVSDPSCRQFHILADMLGVRLSRLPAEKTGVAGYWQTVIRRRQKAVRQNRDEYGDLPRSDEARLSVAIDELEAVLGPIRDPMLRYEAFNRLFALLGSKLDADAVEFIQTGLAAMPWETLPAGDRNHLAAHLRHLADQVVAPAAESSDREPAFPEPPQPLFDRISLSEQERLVRALREQPADISIDRLLRALASQTPSRS